MMWPMPSRPPPPTPALERQITAFIRAGGYPHVAAEAAGVPRRTFERWLRYGRQSRRDAVYHAFAAAVRQAAAQARLRAEMAALDSKPLDWLKYGPGKETADNPGWTATVRPAPRDNGGATHVLEHAEFRALFALVRQLLAPYPGATEAVAVQALSSKLSRRGRRS
jgi:hypothetical protein